MKRQMKQRLRKLALYSYLDGMEGYVKLFLEIFFSYDEPEVRYYKESLKKIKEYFELEEKTWKKKKQAR